ncbi:unnamed protein product [Closterium sp. NIES-54]
MALRPSSVPLRVPLPSPPISSLADGPDLESDFVHAASPTVTRLLATVVTDPLFESAATSALVAELADFAPPVISTTPLEDFECLASAAPHLVAMLLAPEGDPNAPHIPTPCSYAEAITGPYSSQWQTAMDTEMASLKSTGTYVNTVPPLGVNIINGMWIFKVKRSPGSPPVFKACYVARGFRLVLGGRGPVVLTGHANASWVDDLAMQRSSQGYTFSLGSDSVSWRSTCLSSVLSSSCEAEIYARAMAAQELRWLIYLLTDLGERPRSPPVLYVDNKAMIAL